jgi:hypothetical protein
MSGGKNHHPGILIICTSTMYLVQYRYRYCAGSACLPAFQNRGKRSKYGGILWGQIKCQYRYVSVELLLLQSVGTKSNVLDGTKFQNAKTVRIIICRLCVGGRYLILVASPNFDWWGVPHQCRFFYVVSTYSLVVHSAFNGSEVPKSYAAKDPCPQSESELSLLFYRNSSLQFHWSQ